MSTRGLRKWALLLTFWLALHTSALRAQLVGPYGTSPTTFGVDANGLLSDTGTYGTGTLSLSGAGTKMFWYPGKAAFRAGYASGTEWNDANIGACSTAFGFETVASGAYSTALGYQTHATQAWATAFGWTTTASGYGATSFGEGTTASGNDSTAFGQSTHAAGFQSTASGYGTFANADLTATFGYLNVANSIYDFVVGRNNLGGNTGTGHWWDTGAWVGTDPLFEIGNGTDGAHRSDAFIVYKNGNATMNGVDNKLPNQTLTGSSSILTRGLADARYLTATGSTATSVALFTGASATGLDSLALGNYASASGNYAVALGGENVTANGNWAMALNGTAYGDGTLAIDGYATGNSTIAIGGTASGICSMGLNGGNASGYRSTAMNSGYASGNYSTASGYYTSASAYSSFVIGFANVGLSSTGDTPSPTTWVATDPLFEVGNGNIWGIGNPDQGGPADAFVVYKNGNTVVQGNVATGGTVTSGGNVTAPAFIATTQTGDIPMYSGN